MKKFGLFLLMAAVILSAPSVSRSSEVILNIVPLTNLADIAVAAKCISATGDETEIEGRVAKLIRYRLLINEVIKNDAGALLTAGEEAEFVTFAPGRLMPGSEYVLFLQKISPEGVTPEIWAFIGGGQGIFLKEGAFLKNKLNNRGLFTNVKSGITGSETEGLGLKELKQKDIETMDQLQGAVEEETFIDVVKRVKKMKEIEKEEIKKEEIKKGEKAEKVEKVK